MQTTHFARRQVLTGLTLLGGLTAAGLPARAEPAGPRRYDLAEGPLKVRVVDLSPRFLAFYAAAKDEPDADRRFALWKSLYGFAAVPPGPRGEAMARQLLDAGWPKYPAALPVIRAGATAMRPDPLWVLKGVARVLQPSEPLAVQVTAYVGAFEDNAFTYRGELPTVCVPLEMEPGFRKRVFAHEMTHAVHMAVGRLSGGWERSIGATLIQEGLAMHVSREVVPGLTERDYVGGEDGWWTAAKRRRADILAGMEPYLEAKDGETVFKFTIGQGTTGLNREAYVAGWFVIQALRAEGMSFARIARIPEAEMPAVARRAFAAIRGEMG